MCFIFKKKIPLYHLPGSLGGAIGSCTGAFLYVLSFALYLKIKERSRMKQGPSCNSDGLKKKKKGLGTEGVAC